MRKIILGVMIVLASAALTARAADFGIFVSHWETDEGGSSLGGGVGMHFATLPIELRASFYPDLSIRGAGDTTVVPLDLGFAVNLSRAAQFDTYVGLGGSYYIIDTDRGDPDNEFGWYALARLELPLNRGQKLFGEVMYRGVEFDDVNADLSGPCFAIGIIFR